MQIRYQSEKKEKENENLKQQQNLKNEIIAKQNMAIIAISLGFILVIVSAVVLVRSNNQKKRLNTQLQSQNEKIESIAKDLKLSNSTKDKFFSIIAHDLKNPFHSIMSVNSLLIEYYPDLTDEKILEFLSKMHQTTKNAYTLLENLLQWSRSQMGRIEFEPEEIELIEVVSTNRLLLKSMADEKLIRLTVNVDESIKIFADRNMMNTIVRNLMINAIKFTPENGEVTIDAQEDQEFILVSVTDTGIGISEGDKNKLFSLGETPIAVGTRNEKGTGLGLLLCKEFVETQHGTIWFTSELNKGTSFYFTIPKFIPGA